MSYLMRQGRRITRTPRTRDGHHRTKTRCAAIHIALLTLAATFVVTGCGPFQLYDCTIANPRLEFTGGNTYTKFTWWCIHKPNTLYIQVVTQWRNKSASTWDLVSKKILHLKDIPDHGEHATVTITGVCYARTRERVWIHGAVTSDTGQHTTLNKKYPSIYGKRTLLCNIIGGH